MEIECTCACGIPLRVAVEYAGRGTKCPQCGRTVTVPVPGAPSTAPDLNPGPPQSQAVCPICKWPFATDEARTHCPACQTEYHAACWQENGGCGVYGCTAAPATEARAPLEIPASYWGQENKPCPSCGTMILASAVRCRNCGAMFSSSRPEDRMEYQGRKAAESRLPAVRRGVVWLFAFCVIPLTAPFAVLIGSCWYFSNRADIEMLSPLHAAMSKISLYVAAGQTLFILLAVVIFAARQG